VAFFGRRPAQTHRRELSGAPAAAPLSIVVLPFANLSGDPAQDYFADGVTDNLTTELSHIRHSFVIAHNTALSYKGNGLYKAEVIHRRGPWRSYEAVEFATLEWVDWFNNRRLLEPIGNIPPAEAEERYYAMMEQPAMAA
jgi:hypothetical protein